MKFFNPYSICSALLLPAIASAHSGHGSENFLIHELEHFSWLLLIVASLAVVGLIKKVRQN